MTKNEAMQEAFRSRDCVLTNQTVHLVRKGCSKCRCGFLDRGLLTSDDTDVVYVQSRQRKKKSK